MTLLSIFLVLNVICLFTTSFAYVCEVEWVNYESYCYRKLHYDTDYSDAVYQCRYNYAELLTIDSANEQDFVTTYLVDEKNNIWLDADNSKYENWYNQSLGKKVKPVARQCAVVMMVKRYEAKWFKEDCLNKNEVVCKRPTGVHPTPKPTPRPTTRPTSAPTTQRPTEPPTTTPPTPKPTTPNPRPTTLLPTNCKPGWRQFRNKCYKVTININYFGTAENECDNDSAKLTSIHSKAENDFIATLYEPSKHGTGNIWFRIGAYSNNVPRFYWLDGTNFNYTNWCRGCPTTISDRKIVWYSMNRNDRYKEWVNDVDYDRYSVCSYEINTQPTTPRPPTTTTRPTPRPADCKSGWKQFNRKCYRVTDTYRQLEDNQKECESWGASLTSVHSSAENDFIVSLYDKNKHVQPSYYIWFQLGARTHSVPNFYWIDGTSFDYTNWDSSPDQRSTYTSVQVCADTHQINTYYKKWSNFIESDKGFGVCSYWL